MARMELMSGIERIVEHLAEAVEADIDAGELDQEIDRSVLADLRKTGPSVAQPVPEVPPPVKRIPVETPPPVASEAPVGKETISSISEEVSTCTKCGLSKTRKNAVPGQGNPSPDIMFIGEAPGADEDAQGLAFVGRAGKLLTKMIIAMGLTRDEVFIGNMLKCRPPDNRVPLPDEMTMCMPYLLRQIKVLKPKVIVALGGTAVKGLLKTEEGITKIRGNWTEYEGVPFMPTLHPAYLLRNPKAKRDAWDDLQAVLKKLGREAPPPQTQAESTS